MSTPTSHDEPPEHGTHHVTDDLGHGHGHGAAPDFEFIPEDSKLDGPLGFYSLLAIATWLGMLFFAWCMFTGHPAEAVSAGHENGGHEAAGAKPATTNSPEHATPPQETH